ncbi:glycosyltransferase family 4 protein [Fusobacterium mortiferum]|uniref:glycosyltransferase n=1 Tax=Fusobacterium mortiferum TaxID=850 RepID=UPI001F2ADC89|nr:glycosyltransferase [Fusobacterium mortiferum]MCF2628930.1 glycosyltransferase family 4 protein [Fusobacterium mortiferum]
MNEILYVTNRLNPKNKNGAYIGAKRNYEHLKEIFKEKFDEYLIGEKNKFEKFILTFVCGRLDEISKVDEEKILKKLETKKYKYIFLDGSNYGYCVEKIKRKYPYIKVITFCHDISYQLYESLYHQSLTFFSKVKFKKYIKNALKNEKLTFKNSNIIITLNSRDSFMLEKVYNKKSNKEIGITFPITNILNKEIKMYKENLKILFVGIGTFLPNIYGIEFFIKKVLPYINAELEIVGKGTETNKEKWESLNSKVKVRGTVGSLDEYYNDADAVIAPIFIGGGMKVKTAEALSYGKTIFGTTEAFEGYEVNYKKIGGMCNTAEEFIEAINKYIKWWKNNNKPTFNKDSYQIFKEKYSYEASLKKFKEIFKELEEMERE